MHAYRPRGRLAHSHSSRVGQAWTQTKAWVFNNDFGVIKQLPIGHFECPKCGFVVEMEKRGCAFCPDCGAIFNDNVSPPKETKRDIHAIMRSVA